MTTPVQAATRTTMRPHRGLPDCCRGCTVLANLHPLHPRSLGSAVFDTSHTRPVRVNGELVWRKVKRWTVVDAVRGSDGRVEWLTGEFYPESE